MLLDENQIKKEIEDLKIDLKLNIAIPKDIENILNFTREDLKTRTTDELAIDVIQLAQYAGRLKLEENRFRAVISYCSANVSSIIGREAPNLSCYSYYEKKDIICREDKDAYRLSSVKAFVETKLSIIDKMFERIEFMAQSIRGLIFARKQ